MASPRGEPDSTPICRCRVLYLGSAVPHVTKDGLQGIQEPLRELYPEQGALGARGIDSWLSVWSNGLLLENVDENHKKVTRFFPIDSLHYCAAVRYVLVPEKLSSGPSQPATPRFLPLDSPFARTPNPSHPPLFAAILRRTTGIKVLECHAFICKREMAANALVRCCFHAYADSSYARNIDGGSSIYGTLRSQSQNTNNPPPLNNSFDKVEGWRRMSPGQETRGSTLTLNSQHNGTLKSNGTLDNISIYNGDENHKVWAGPGGPLDREELYGNYNGSTMRSTKSVRPRQMVAPVAVPPPPPPPKEDKKTAKKTQKERARRKKMVGGNREELYPLMNGSLMRPGTQMRAASSMSAPGIYSNGGGTMVRPSNGGTLMRPTNGTLMRPTNGYHHHHHHQQQQHLQQQQQPIILMHPNATLPHPRQMQGGKRAGTFSHRPKGLMVRPVPPPFIPVPLPPQMVPIHTNKRQPKMMEEPVYMPSARPMSPVASFQPSHFPHEAYLMQQYANQTMDKPGKKKRDKAKKMNGENGDEEGIDVEESPYNTGIYRKKGHMNERAFSYSIRQEHRSRSYGSLANLKFATPIPNGGGPTGSKEEFKKEREIMQMMTDLELSGDELERREVPAGVYQHGNPAVYHSRQSLTVAAQNGRR